MNGQQQAILLRMQRHEKRDKWWKRSEFQGSSKMRADLDNLVAEHYLETHEHKETLGNGRIVTILMYRLAPAYRAGQPIPTVLGV